jgi:autotransporter-associated beta strand protein
MRLPLTTGSVRLPQVLLALLPLLTAASPAAEKWVVTGWNNLGMHCMDADYSVFSILPPYNTLQAQVVHSTGTTSTNMVTALMTGADGVRVTFEAVADPAGSINRTSAGKTNFWTYAEALYGTALPTDTGLTGSSMPGAANTPQPFTWDASNSCFTAEGIPIVPRDDAGQKNYYPMFRLKAYDATNTLRAQADVVVPVSDEMDCRACHASTAKRNDARPYGGWVNDTNAERDYRLNILKKHDEVLLGTTLYQESLVAKTYREDGLLPTVTMAGKPILCAACHASEALPGSGYAGISPLTQALHSTHATVIDPDNGQMLGAQTNRTACYQCHPGSSTRCLRGAMGSAVAANGSMQMQCQDCHGTMRQVGSASRTGWLDEPSCQQCHTGTAISNNGSIRYPSAFEPSGQPRVAVNQTFATNANTPSAGHSLFRYSSGHGGMKCAACHGSPHAEYPAGANDNVQSAATQGHVGVLAECITCHAVSPSRSRWASGPHSLHPMGSTWIGSHDDYENTDACHACHGTDHRGTVLSEMQATRTLNTKTSTESATFWRGYRIGCYSCHNGTSGDDAPPASPTVTSAAITAAGAPVTFSLGMSPSGAVLRIVAQAVHGTVALSGTTATYFPEPGYAGTDAFTFAARDSTNSVDSALGTISVSAASYLLWRGDGTLNRWDAGTTANWRLNGGSTATTYTNGAAVTFDDTGAASPAIQVPASLTPGAVTVNSSQDYTLGGPSSLGGSMALAKFGGGTLTLGSSNTFTGATAIHGGKVVAPSVAVAAGASSLGNATSVVSLGNAFTKGILSYTGNSATFTRGFSVAAGGGQIDTATSGQKLLVATGNITATGPLTLGGDGDTQINSVVSGGGTLTKTGAGRLIINANQTFSGVVFIDQGTLKMSNGATFAANKNLSVAANAAWLLDGTSQTVNNLTGSGWVGEEAATAGNDTLTVGGGGSSCTFAGSIAGGNGTVAGLRGIALTKTGAGTFILTGENTYTGPTLISGGTLQVGNGSATGTLGTGAVTNSSNLVFNRSDSGYTAIAVPNIISGTGTLTMMGGGRIFLTSTTNSYSGVTLFESGIINVASVSNYGANSSLGNHSASESANDIGLLFRGGTLQYTGSSPQSSNRQIRLSTTGGGGTLDASGQVPAATLSFTAPTSLNLWENSGPRTLTLTGTNSGDNTFLTILADSGGATSLVKSGTGNWVLGGSHGYSGNTSVMAGTLTLTGTINSGPTSTVLAASGGTLRLWDGSITAGKVQVEAGGCLTGRGSITGNLVNSGTVVADDAGVLAVNGTVTNFGTVRLTGGAAIQCSGLFVNNGVFDIITGTQSLPPNFQNNGIILDSSSVRIQSFDLTGADARLTVPTVTGHVYQLQRSGSLGAESWENIGAAIPGDGSPQIFSDPGGSTGAAQRFYRVLVSP